MTSAPFVAHCIRTPLAVGSDVSLFAGAEAKC
jgi:hypothetical protein